MTLIAKNHSRVDTCRHFTGPIPQDLEDEGDEMDGKRRSQRHGKWERSEKRARSPYETKRVEIYRDKTGMDQ